jgi:hypothetical protein
MCKPESYDSLAFLEPWVPVRDYASNLEQELQREVSQGHPLHAKRVHAIAQRGDCDDVLFGIDSSGFGYAVVHLSWTGQRESDPRWPDTHFFATLQDWIENRMKPDHSAFCNARPES